MDQEEYDEAVRELIFNIIEYYQNNMMVNSTPDEVAEEILEEVKDDLKKLF